MLCKIYLKPPKYSNVNMDFEIDRMVYGNEHSLFNLFCNYLKMQQV